MCRFNAPLLWIEVVGACADVLYRPQRMAHEGHHDQTPRCVSRQHNGLATEIADGISIAQVTARNHLIMRPAAVKTT